MFYKEYSLVEHPQGKRNTIDFFNTNHKSNVVTNVPLAEKFL